MDHLTSSTTSKICETWQISDHRIGRAALFPIQPAPASLDEASLHLPAGAYTTFRSYHHDRAFHLEDHLNRLEESARLSGQEVSLDRELVRYAIRQAIRACDNPESRVRLSLDLSRQVGDVYVSLEGLVTPSEKQYAEGVKVISLHIARENPQAKLTGFIARASELRRSLPAGVAEGIMLDADVNILEGLSSNFFGVIGGEIYTSNQSVLAGITRALVLEEARQAGYPIHLGRLPYSFSQRFDEAFITSSSRAVLPVVQIDLIRIGSGQPGSISRDLLSRYLVRIEREIEPI